MHYTTRTAIALMAASLLAGACTSDNRNTYNAQDVGHDAVVRYGIIKSSRPVAVQGENTGTGTTIGGVSGGLAGSAFGAGTGSFASIIGGALIGGIAGTLGEESLKDRQGVEYIVRMSDSGETRSIVQTMEKAETPIPTGQCVMLQMSGSYQRLLPDKDALDCPTPPQPVISDR